MGAARDLDPLASRLAGDGLDGIDQPSADSLAAHAVIDNDGRDSGERGVVADHVADLQCREAYNPAFEFRDQNVLTGLGRHVGEARDDLVCRRGVAELSQQLRDLRRVGLSGSAYLHSG
jgi:hypothetical protein